MSKKICGADENAGCHCPRFEDIAQNCPWRRDCIYKETPELDFRVCKVFIGDVNGATPCSPTNCAFWYWKKK